MKMNFKIASNENVADGTWRLELRSQDPAYLFRGEFMDLAIPGFYLRRPLSVCDAAPGKVVIYYKVVGEGTKVLATLPEGTQIEALTDLGRGFEASKCRSRALLVSGGLGSAPLFPLLKELKAERKTVNVVMGFNKASDIVLEEEYRALCDSLTITTLDGSAGMKGLVTDALEALRPEYDFFYTCGPVVMMKAVCKALPGPGQLSLEERMGCGSGFCYGCSIQTASGPRRVCKDGPVFDKEDMLW